MNTLLDLEAEIEVLRKQLGLVQADLTKLQDKEGDIKARLQNLQIKVDRLLGAQNETTCGSDLVI